MLAQQLVQAGDRIGDAAATERSSEAGRFDEFELLFEEGECVLDGLLRLRYGPAPDLAFQFSCFNANVCKECVVMIDGRSAMPASPSSGRGL